MQSRDDGSLRARFVYVLEAYGHWETVYGRPLVGASYTDKCMPWWSEVGLKREDFYITNSFDQGEPSRGIGAIPEYEMRASFDRLHDRLAQLEGPDGGGPYCIVTGGNYATYALTGNGRVSFHTYDGRHKRPGIQDWRGSILSYTDRRGRVIKVIPTPHPAFTFRQPSWNWVLRADWKRIAADGMFRELRLPQRTRMIAPSKAEAVQWIRWTREVAAKNRYNAPYFGRLACSLDVETPNKSEYEIRQKESTSANGKCRGCGHAKRWHQEPTLVSAFLTFHCAGLRGKGGCACTGFQPILSAPRKVKIADNPFLGCIGYSWDPRSALCIPTTLEYWQDPAVFAEVMAEIAAFHADINVDFGGQNFGFDAWWCAEERVPLWNLGWDLMKQHRTQRPFSEWHDLAFQASIDTREPFWKHEAKLPDEISRWSHNKEQLWLYNCTDNCVQRELLPIRVKALQAAGRLEYYEQMERPVDARLLSLSRWGIRADVEGRKKAHAAACEEADRIAEEANTLAGQKLTGDAAFSNAKLKLWLYGDGTVEKLYERPEVEVTSATAKCAACGHARNRHDAVCFGVRKQPCDCAAFVAPKKLGKRVQVGERAKGGLRLPQQFTKNAEKKRVVTVNVVAIKRLMEQFPSLDLLQHVGKKILRHRRLQTEKSNLKAERLLNGRQYAIFKQDTILGRLSSSETPKGDGANLQNVDRKLRKYYLPDTGDESLGL